MYPYEVELQKLKDWQPKHFIPNEIKTANSKLYKLCLDFLEDRKLRKIRWHLDAQTRGGHTNFPIEEETLRTWRQEKIEADSTFSARLAEIEAEFTLSSNLQTPTLRGFIDNIGSLLPSQH